MRVVPWLVVLTACSTEPASEPPVDSGVVDTGAIDSGVVDTGPEVDAGCAPLARTAIDPRGTPVTIAGDLGSTLGVFDPSIAGDAMSYSSVPAQDAIFTRIAVTADKGATWTYVADANAPIPITAPSTDPECSTCTGRLIHEVTSLVVDPTDVPSRRYKLFVHSYFVFPGVSPPKLRYDWGRITMEVAPEPKGPWSTPEKGLGWASSMPAVSLDGVGQRLTDVPDLAKCIAFTEPSAMVTPSTLELALGCVELATPPTIRVVLLRSADHGKTFSFVGTLLRPSDGACAGGSAPQVNAAHLFDVGGKPYVLASPAATVPPGFTGYNGCALYEIADLATASIRRRADGTPVIARWIDAGGGFAGACTHAPDGYYVSALASTSPLAFRIFRSAAP